MMEGNEVSGSAELKKLRELVEFLKASGIAEFDLERENLKLRLKFQGAAAEAAPGIDMGQLARLMASAQTPVMTTQAHVAAVHGMPNEVGHNAPAAPAPVEEKHHVVKSPIVGTFYEAPSPGSPPFVKVGDMVEVGQVLCIIEAMKLMNEIESDAAGEVVERIAQGGQPVEYGQALFSIKAR